MSALEQAAERVRLAHKAYSDALARRKAAQEAHDAAGRDADKAQAETWNASNALCALARGDDANAR